MVAWADLPHAACRQMGRACVNAGASARWRMPLGVVLLLVLAAARAAGAEHGADDGTASAAGGAASAEAASAPEAGEAGEAAEAAEATAAAETPSYDAPIVTPAQAGIETRVVVRARARGANYVTTDMGAKVTLRDANTGELLAQGITLGTVAGSDPQLTAAFRTTLALHQPVLVEATVQGPLNYPHAQVQVSSVQWVLPGRHVEAEGWVLELPGFVVTVEDPPERVPLGPLRLTVKVVMMCGCPTKPGGEWDADAYELRAHLMRAGELVASVPLVYTGEASTYHLDLVMREPGDHEVLVSAFDPVHANSGVTRIPLYATNGAHAK